MKKTSKTIKEPLYLIDALPKRKKVAKEKIGFAVGTCSFGKILVATCEMGIVAILTGKNAESLVKDLRHRFSKSDLRKADVEAKTSLPYVIDFIEKPGAKFKLPFYIKGTVFQKRVWQAVCEIPIGQTATYSDIARKIGSPKAMRAVGNTCSNNNLFLVVPCHRVIRSDRSILSESRRGQSQQRILIDRETKAK